MPLRQPRCRWEQYTPGAALARSHRGLRGETGGPEEAFDGSLEIGRRSREYDRLPRATGSLAVWPGRPTAALLALS
jgi:hypothetical protein